MKKFTVEPTAAGHVCSKCGKGFFCWTGPDEPPCKHKLIQFNKVSLRKYLKKVPENKEVKKYLRK